MTQRSNTYDACPCLKSVEIAPFRLNVEPGLPETLPETSLSRVWQILFISLIFNDLG